jgi:hypothetical protein
MLKVLKSFFNSNRKSSTSFYSFYKNIVKWRESKVFPYSFNLPEVIQLPSDFWKQVSKIYMDTNRDGKERAISLFWADGELVLTSVVKGDERSVKSKHALNIKYEQHPTRKGYLRKELIVDGKVKKRKDVYYKKAPKKVIVEYLFNMHTHPPHINQEGIKKYGFFSSQDIKSFLSSNAIVTGLVTDRLWLLVRTSESLSNLNIEQSDITSQNLKEKFSFVVYMAEFNKNAVKQ